VVLITEVIAAKFAIGSFVISTQAEDHREAVLSQHLLMLCALPLLAAAVTYWTIGRSRPAGVLLAVAALATTFGLFVWAATLPLVLIAIVGPLSRDPVVWKWHFN
jgi:hypothetical protein